jgi:DNA-directed RNA polymerase subunit RPC12/RpoP
MNKGVSLVQTNREMRILFICKNVLILSVLIALNVNCENQADKEEIVDKKQTESCCDAENSTNSSETSEITCPKCGHKAVEKLPTEVCLIKYNCKKCTTELTPEGDDCCVFCTHGTHKCPSKQDE